ncbi:hypothetical protein V2J09_004904 [Rumex salicifolius]
MNLSVNGHSQVPPGFRFHPTEEELLLYYLKKKVANQKIDLDVIQDIDLNKLEPWDIQEKCRIGSGPQTDWYIFSHKDKKYPTGSRTNRATSAGFWKATGRDKVICNSSSRIGMRKTLVFYKGRAPHGEKSDWIMHEYRLDDHILDHDKCNMINGDQSGVEEGWVVCRVFRKKNYVKAQDVDDSPTNQRSMDLKSHDLDHILSCMGSSSPKEKIKANAFSMRYHEIGQMESFTHLPQLETPVDQNEMMMMINYGESNNLSSSTHWAELDRLVAYQLNGQTTQANFLGDTATATATANYEHLIRSHNTNDDDDDQFWSFNKQSSSSTTLDPILHFSV